MDDKLKLPNRVVPAASFNFETPKDSGMIARSIVPVFGCHTPLGVSELNEADRRDTPAISAAEFPVDEAQSPREFLVEAARNSNGRPRMSQKV